MERTSAKVLIIWFVLLLLFSAYGTILDALVMPAPSVPTLFATVFSWLATLFYATLLVFKVRVQGAGR